MRLNDVDRVRLQRRRLGLGRRALCDELGVPERTLIAACAGDAAAAAVVIEAMRDEGLFPWERDIAPWEEAHLLRRRLGVTAAELGRLMEVTKQTILNREAGKRLNALPDHNRTLRGYLTCPERIRKELDER